MAKKPTYEELEQRVKELEGEALEGKRAEEALRESEKRYRYISEMTSDYIARISVDANGEMSVDYVTEEYSRVMGYSIDELKTSDMWHKVVHPDDMDTLLKFFQTIISGQSCEWKIREVTRKGEIRWLHCYAKPEFEKGKKRVVAIVAASKDVTEKKLAEEALQKAHDELERRVEERTADLVKTNDKLKRQIQERKRAEEALRRSEQKFKDLTETTTDWVWEVDVQGVYTYASPKIKDLLGYEVSEVLGKTPFDLMPKEEAERIRKFFNENVINREPFYGLENVNRHKDGHLVVLETNGIPIFDEKDQLKGYRGIDRDITYRKRAAEEKEKLQAQLLQAQKLEAIGTLSGGIAHDFNNVLMGIQGHSSLALLYADSGRPHSEHLKGIEDMVQRGADLTKQLLGFARGGKYEVRPTDLNELIENSSEMFGRTKKEIKIHRKYQEDIWPVEVDRGQIDQVLLNLYVNAWQSMPRGGDLYIETSSVVLDENYTKPFGVKPGSYVKISVTDTGVGMDKATQQRIFDPFFTTKEMGRGTGLGLASAYGIIKNHGGIINVYSEKGEGTTFNIYLPASQKEVTTEEKRLADEILKGTETVLLVDDEAMILDVGEEMLKEMGYNVLLARSGKEAVEVFGKHKDEIDLVILDMIMPEMGGGEAYDRMKENNPKVKALLSSGYSIDGQATEILERGCDGFIQKPFNMKELSTKIRQILGKE